ncbi:unnamed protein product [Closterium sp. NIES-54]
MKKLPLVAKRSPPFPSPPPPPPSHRCHWDLAASAYPQFFQAFAAERKDGDEKVPSRFRRKKLPKSERRAVAGSGGAELAGASAHPVDFFDIRGEYSDFESMPQSGPAPSPSQLHKRVACGSAAAGGLPQRGGHCAQQLGQAEGPCQAMLHGFPPPPPYSVLRVQLHRRATVDSSGRIQCGGQLAQTEGQFLPMSCLATFLPYTLRPSPSASSTDALPLILVDGYNAVGSWPKLKGPCLSATLLPHTLHPPPSSSSTDALPLILVDGYNVVGSWPKLKKPFHPTSQHTALCILPCLPSSTHALPLILVDGYNVVGSWPKLTKPFHPTSQHTALCILPCLPSSTDVLPLVLVDGYNVVGSWPKLKKPFLRGDTEEARERLLLEVLPYPRYAGRQGRGYCWKCCHTPDMLVGAAAAATAAAAGGCFLSRHLEENRF